MFSLAFRHQKAVAAILDTAPASVTAILTQIWQLASSANIPWEKILVAFMTAAIGGFSPAAIAAAIASLFGASIPAALVPHANATSTVPAV